MFAISGVDLEPVSYTVCAFGLVQFYSFLWKELVQYLLSVTDLADPGGHSSRRDNVRMQLTFLFVS